MGLLDGLIGQISENAEVKNLAAKVGMTPEQIESAIMALAQAHPQPGDTVTAAAVNTGFSPAVLSQIVEHIGGEGALGSFASVLAQNSGVLSQLGGLASGFLGKK